MLLIQNSSSDPDPTFHIISDLDSNPDPDPDPISDPALIFYNIFSINFPLYPRLVSVLDSIFQLSDVSFCRM